jgi:hypothetical protein
MNGKQRMAAAMRHQEPDRVPVMCQLSLGHYFLNAGLPPHRVWFTSEGFAEALVRLQRRYRFDGILINIPGRPENILDGVERIEQIAGGGEKLVWRNGESTIMPPNDSPHHYSANGVPPKRADFATLDPEGLDGVDALTGYIWNTYHVPRLPGRERPWLLDEVPEYFHRTFDLVKAAVGDEVSVHEEVFSPFTHLMELFGYEEALMGLMTDPAKCHQLLDRFADVSVAHGAAQARRGADAILISSAFAGGGFISREMYREFVVPYERRLTDAIRSLGVPVYTHTCGRIGDRLELMAETGIDGVDTLDPPPLGNVELAEAKRTIGERLFIKGNMNSVALLEYRTKEQVIAEASERIRIGKTGGGYILSTACSVAPGVEPWKLELLTPLAEEIGRYVPVTQ